MDAGGIEFAPIDRVVGVGVAQRRGQAFEPQRFELCPRRTENRIRRQFLQIHRCRSAKRHSRLGGSKIGRRFSRAAANPSRTSASLKPRNSRASEVSKLGPARRNQLFSACLVKRMAVALPDLKVRAISSAVSITSASGTATATSPMRSASAPDKGLLVSKWYLALARPQSSGQMMTA